MRFSSTLKIASIIVLFLFVGRTLTAYADFKLLDAMEEFGEKRFVETKLGRI